MTTTPRPVPSVRSYADVKNLAGTFQPATQRRRQTIEEHLTTVKNIAYGSAIACIVLSIGFTLQLVGR